MGSLQRSNCYNPLDQSQIEFIPSDLESINGSEGDSFPRPSWISSQRRGSQADSLDSGSFGGGSSRIANGCNRLDGAGARTVSSSQLSEHSDVYTLSQMSTATSRSSLVQRVRYRIVLRLNPRERNLIRGSWAIILNDDSTNNIAAYSKLRQNQAKSVKPQLNVNSPQKIGRFAGHSRQGSSNSNHFVEPKMGVRSNAFTSSLFCSQFYANLLSMEPSLEQMFPSTRHQAVAFAGVLTAAINNLENLQVLENFLNGLGKRHARILGIEPPHFELMGVAFLRTLQDRFGVHCTVELEDAWSKLYSYLANSILQFGIDPVLQVRFEEDTLELPVPDLIERTPKTVVNLKQNARVDQESLGSGSSLSSAKEPETDSAASPPADSPTGRTSVHRQPLPTPTKNSNYNAVSTPPWGYNSSTTTPNTTAPASPTRKPTFSSNKKARHKKSEARRSFARPIGSSSNKDCVIM